MKNWQFVTLFRAIAAFWVLVAHCTIWADWGSMAVPRPMLAVNLFMILSGFLMAANAIERESHELLSEVIGWPRFWVRRYFRIAPAYYLTLAFAYVLNSSFLRGYSNLQLLAPERWPAGGPYDPSKVSYDASNLLWHLTFLFGLSPRYASSTMLPDWSLGLEMQFYLVFPLIALLISRFSVLPVVCVLAAAGVGISRGLAGYVHFGEPSFLPLKLSYFLCGILLCYGVESKIGPLTRVAALIIGLTLVALDLSNGRSTIILLVVFIIMALLGRLECNGHTPGWLRNLVSSSPVRFAADTSYGVYLFHGFFISAFGNLMISFPDVLNRTPMQRCTLMLLFVIAMSYAMGHVVLEFVEKPGIVAGKHLLRFYDKIAFQLDAAATRFPAATANLDGPEGVTSGLCSSRSDGVRRRLISRNG